MYNPHYTRSYIFLLYSIHGWNSSPPPYRFLSHCTSLQMTGHIRHRQSYPYRKRCTQTVNILYSPLQNRYSQEPDYNTLFTDQIMYLFNLFIIFTALIDLLLPGIHLFLYFFRLFHPVCTVFKRRINTEYQRNCIIEYEIV